MSRVSDASDTHVLNHRITKFNQKGEFISKFGTHGDGKGEFDGPSGFALDINDNFVICDSKNNRVQRYTKNGEYINSFGRFGIPVNVIYSSSVPQGILLSEVLTVKDLLSTFESIKND